MASLQWSAESVTDGVRRREFVANGARGDEVPGVLWTPAEAGDDLPLILVGHGTGQHSSHPVVAILVRRIMAANGTAVACIDWPGHGPRGSIDSLDSDYFLDLLEEPGLWERGAEDWSNALTGLLETGEIAAERIAYMGISLGGYFGLPFGAQDERLSALVLGLMGLGSPMLERAGRTPPPNMQAEHAAQISIPTFFFVQWDDSVIPMDISIDAFSKLGTSYKRFVAAPGDHALVPNDVIDSALEFVAGVFESKDAPGLLLDELFRQ